MNEEPPWVDVVQVLYEMEGRGERQNPPEKEDLYDRPSDDELKRRQAENVADKIYKGKFGNAPIEEPKVYQVRTILENLAEFGLIKKGRTPAQDWRQQIKPGPSGEVIYTLTEKGFSIAHDYHQNRLERERERRRNQRQHEVNQSIGILTLGLVFVGVIQATVTAMAGAGSTLYELNGALIAGFLIFGIAVALVWKAGLLTRESEHL